MSGVCLRPQVARLSESQATEEEIVDDLRQLLVKFMRLRHQKCCPFSPCGLAILNGLDTDLYTRVAEHHGWPSFENGRAQQDGSAFCNGATRLKNINHVHRHARDIGSRAEMFAQPSDPSDDEYEVEIEYVCNVLAVAHQLLREVLEQQFWMSSSRLLVLLLVTPQPAMH